MTQFIRSIGSTVGTAVTAWLVTTGYTKHLIISAPTGTPSSLLSSLTSPNALTSSTARSALEAIARAAGKTDLVEPLLAAARSALGTGIHDGMLFMCVCGLLAMMVAVLLPHITINKATEDKPEEEPTSANTVAMH